MLVCLGTSVLLLGDLFVFMSCSKKRGVGGKKGGHGLVPLSPTHTSVLNFSKKHRVKPPFSVLCLLMYRQ